MLGNIDLHTAGASAEDEQKFNVIMPLSRSQYNKSLETEAARRVVFANCMTKCELDHEKVPNFNKRFYYNQTEDQACLQTCFNTRVEAHFGKKECEERALFMDFAAMKKEYQGYEMWNPHNRIAKQYERGFEEPKIKSMMSNLKEKSMNRGSKFDFQ